MSSVAKMPRLSIKTTNGSNDENGSGNKPGDAEEWVAEDGTR